MYRVRQAAEALEIDENEEKKKNSHDIGHTQPCAIIPPRSRILRIFFIKFELYQEHDPPLIPIDNNRLFFNVS